MEEKTERRWVAIREGEKKKKKKIETERREEKRRGMGTVKQIEREKRWVGSGKVRRRR
jgi:hypothetical protein